MRTSQIAPDHKEKLHGWMITYNQYMDIWQAARREDKDLLFNGEAKSGKVISTKDFGNLVTLICTTDEAETV